MNLYDPEINRINVLLETIGYWSSIYDVGASYDLVDLLDLVYDLQLELKASTAVLPVSEEEIEAQDAVAQEDKFYPIPHLPGCNDEYGTKELPSLQILMKLLNFPVVPEQIAVALPILKKIPSRIVEFLIKRKTMIEQYKQHQQKLQEQQSQQPQQEQPVPQQEDQPGTGVIERHFSDYPELSGDPQNPELMSRCMECLIHACQCEADCELASCRRMKRVMRHLYHCKPRMTGDCLMCKQLYELSCHHTRVCQVKENCPMPFCFFIKQKAKEDALQELMPLIRNPKTPEMKKRILEIVKKDQSLLAEVIKDRENFDHCVSWLVILDLEKEPSVDASSSSQESSVDASSSQESSVDASSSQEPSVDASSPQEPSVDANQVNPEGEQSSSSTQGCTQPKVHKRQKINKMVMHVKTCKRRINDYNCLPCKRLRVFYGHHALLCQEEGNNCTIPFCFNVKKRLKELPECHRLLCTQLRRRYYHWA